MGDAEQRVCGLINQLKAAEGGSEDLDVGITHCVSLLALNAPELSSVLIAAAASPMFTRSVDQALLLIPAGVWWNLQHFAGPTGSGEESYRATITMPDTVQSISAIAPTPALAICIAGLEGLKPP